MNEIIAHGNNKSVTDIMLQENSFNQVVRMAELMSTCKNMVPDFLRNSPGDCMAVIIQAIEWNLNPFQVAKKTYNVKGTIGYEAQLVNAVVCSSDAVVENHFKFDFIGDWDRIMGKFDVVMGDNGEYKKPAWGRQDEGGLGVIVSATIKGDSVPTPMTIMLTQAQTRNSTLWATNPKQQLSYFAVNNWARLHTPAVLMGVYTRDELDASEPMIKEKNITPIVEPAVQESALGAPVEAEPEPVQGTVIEEPATELNEAEQLIVLMKKCVNGEQLAAVAEDMKHIDSYFFEIELAEAKKVYRQKYTEIHGHPPKPVKKTKPQPQPETNNWDQPFTEGVVG